MYGCDTGEVPAVCVGQLKHYEHVHTEDVHMISELIGWFGKLAKGNGRLLLRVFGGNITAYEPTPDIQRTGKKKRSA